jgi:exodeoxyribonuclease VIII
MNTGIYTNLTNSEYRQADGINASSLKDMVDSPAHYRWWQDHQKEPSAAMKIGTAVDHMLLTPGREAPFWFMPEGIDGRSKEGNALKEANASKFTLTSDEATTCRQCVKSVLANLAARRCVEEGKNQVAWFAPLPVDDDEGSPAPGCKGLVDIVTAQEFLVDLKTCRDASPAGFGRSAVEYKYGLQAAFYLDGYNKANAGQPAKTGFAFIAVETSAPFNCVVYYMRAQEIDLGRSQYRKAMKQLLYCRQVEDWPGYEPIQALVYPSWAYNGGLV